MHKKPDEERRRPVQIDDDTADGTYSNVAQVMFSPAEFVVDFGRIVPGREQVKIFSRIVLTPAHAKQLATALKENVRRYEEQFGEIRSSRNPAESIEIPDVGFKQ